MGRFRLADHEINDVEFKNNPQYDRFVSSQGQYRSRDNDQLRNFFSTNSDGTVSVTDPASLTSNQRENKFDTEIKDGQRVAVVPESAFNRTLFVGDINTIQATRERYGKGRYYFVPIDGSSSTGAVAVAGAGGDGFAPDARKEALKGNTILSTDSPRGSRTKRNPFLSGSSGKSTLLGE